LATVGRTLSQFKVYFPKMINWRLGKVLDMKITLDK